MPIPGRGVVVCVKRPDGRESRIGVVGALAGALRAKGEKVKERSSWLELPGGLLLLPRVARVEHTADGGWQVGTTIEAKHEAFFPQGIFEFQHTMDRDLGHALCTSINFDQSVAPLGLPFSRQVVLGSILHGVNEERAAEADPHPFCPCCFFTHSMEAMKAKLRERDFFAIRFYAARFETGEVTADCRVNGIDWDEGKAALLAYAATWPDLGFEVRKQYVAIHTRM